MVLIVVSVREVAVAVVEFCDHSKVVIAFVDAGVGAIGVAAKAGRIAGSPERASFNAATCSGDDSEFQRKVTT